MAHLAQMNIARLVAPIDDPRLAGFVAQLDEINKLAENSPGFLWRLQSEGSNATGIVYNDDPLVIVNMSVWESVESLKSYVYSGPHLSAFRERQKWFEKMTVPYGCLWWIPSGHTPSVAEGREKLEHFQKHGATPQAFWFSKPFPAPEEESLSV